MNKLTGDGTLIVLKAVGTKTRGRRQKGMKQVLRNIDKNDYDFPYEKKIKSYFHFFWCLSVQYTLYIYYLLRRNICTYKILYQC